MNEIQIKYENEQLVVSSLQVAKDFEKDHFHVLRDIENLKAKGGIQKWEDLFYKTTYIHEQNKQEYPMYLINKRGFQLLAMGFTGKKAIQWKLKYIDAFEEMEAQQKNLLPRNYKEALLALVAKEEEKEKLLLENKLQEQQIEEMKPKALFADCVSASETSILVGDLAKLLKQNGHDMGANRLFEWLRENGYLIKRQGSDWNMPTQKSMELELFEIKERVVGNPDGSTRITKTPKVTGKGQVYFVEKFNESE